MVVFQVYVHSILAVPTKRDSPIPRDPNRKPSLLSTFEGVKLQAGNIHLLRITRRIKTLKDASDPAHVLNAQFGAVSLFGEPAEALAAKRPKHTLCVQGG